MKALQIAVLTSLVLASACADLSKSTAPEALQPSFALSAPTVATGFHWLPPMSRNADDLGDFDAALHPDVVICRLLDGECESGSEASSATASKAAERVRVGEDGHHYIVNWHTGKAGVHAGDFYRVSVLVGDLVLGSADVRITGTGKPSPALAGEFIDVREGLTLPIKFRIDRGIAATLSVDPGSATLAPGATQELHATILDLHGNQIELPITWTTSDPAVASVDASGLVTAVGAGEVLITANAGGASGSATLTVEAEEPGGGVVAGAGVRHTCAVNELGQANCWGAGGFGRLGNGSQADSPTPALVSGGLVFTAVQAGDMHSCALTALGAAYCWGIGARLGDGTMTTSSVPVAVTGGITFASIASGFNATCGLTDSGAGYCWGLGFNGELGDGLMSFSLAPTAIAGGLSFQSIAVGAVHSCGVASDGAAYCWGSNAFGKLGTGVPGNASTPAPVAGAVVFNSLAASEGHTCGIDVAGAAHCWGAGGSGQIGNGASANSLIPAAVAGGNAFSSLSVGSAHSCALTPAGAAWCWGNGGGGRLGNGATGSSNVPVPVAGGHSFASITAGASHTCAVTVDNSTYCWGTGSSGQLGNGSTTSQLVPTLVSPF